MFNKIYVLKKLEPIILLSHMRANTSLFGHILGNNPAINGYYEMHIGYYSWKSFIRQKLKFLGHHSIKTNSHYIFDKVLHNEHEINCDLLKKKAQIIISLREPEETIPSIINLFNKSAPNHEFTTTQGAIEYYKKRLLMLEKYSNLLKDCYFYIDANSIKSDTEKTFSFIEDKLSLATPLSIEYELQKMTGASKSGDSSQALKQGKLIKSSHTYSNIKLNPEEKNEMTNLYKKTRNILIKNSKDHLPYQLK